MTMTDVNVIFVRMMMWTRIKQIKLMRMSVTDDHGYELDDDAASHRHTDNEDECDASYTTRSPEQSLSQTLADAP